jgi:HTH-type transcriptional regulator / antitoxin HigA
MIDRKAAEVFPPGEFIKEELEARNWSQVELAEIIGRQPSLVNELISGKRSISPEIARDLGEAFGTSAQYWLNLENIYQLWRVSDVDTVITRRARLYQLVPIKEMIKRHWLEPSGNIEVLENNIKRFFEINDLSDKIKFAHAARRGRREPPTPAQNAWLFRAKHLAKGVHAKSYTAQSFSDSLNQLRRLLHNAQEIRHVPRILSENGIRFLIVEQLAHTRIDGVTFWLDSKSPVIVISLRYDRVDAFWYTLAHELGHVKRRDGLINEVIIDTDLVGDEHEITNQEKDPEQAAERLANEFATHFLINQEKMNDFILRVRPLYGAQKIIEFAHLSGVHPGLVVGQLQFRKEIPWSSCRKMLEKVRHIIIPSSLTDGWGQTLSMS